MLYFPGLHTAQAVLPMLDVYVPIAHVLHPVDESADV
jgi:hypothetical protein